MRAVPIFIAPSLLLAAAQLQAGASATTGRIAWVIDGDTFRLSSGERIRIADIDAPESRADQAKCAVEQARGKVVTRAVIPLLKGREVSVERVGRSYDRTVARVRMGGDDLGAILVSKGLARWWLRDQPKPDWCRG